jgi:hypothetical protein
MFSKSGEWELLGQPVYDVRIEQLQTNILSLDFFDRLFDNKIIRENGGYIKKCLEEYKDEFIVSDELRKVNLNEINSIRFIHLFLGFNYG